LSAKVTAGHIAFSKLAHELAVIINYNLIIASVLKNTALACELEEDHGECPRFRGVSRTRSRHLRDTG
jgi:hypothetical protein